MRRRISPSVQHKYHCRRYLAGALLDNPTPPIFAAENNMSSLPPPINFYSPPILTHRIPTSRGSFGPVFAVLAVITVLAAAACIVGRLCTRRLCQQKDLVVRTHATVDIEDGFDIHIVPMAKPPGKQGANGDTKPAGTKSDAASKHANFADSRRGESHFTNGGRKTKSMPDLK